MRSPFFKNAIFYPEWLSEKEIYNLDNTKSNIRVRKNACRTLSPVDHFCDVILIYELSCLHGTLLLIVCFADIVQI